MIERDAREPGNTGYDPDNCNGYSEVNQKSRPDCSKFVICDGPGAFTPVEQEKGADK